MRKIPVAQKKDARLKKYYLFKNNMKGSEEFGKIYIFLFSKREIVF